MDTRHFLPGRGSSRQHSFPVWLSLQSVMGTGLKAADINENLRYQRNRSFAYLHKVPVAIGQINMMV